MHYLLFIALGGATGAIARYLLSNWVHGLWEGQWPVGTLLVNVLGSFGIGVIFVLIERLTIHSDWRWVLMVGFLGAFTTVSTFSLEAVSMLEAGQVGHAMGYIGASVFCCLAAAAAAIQLTRMAL